VRSPRTRGMTEAAPICSSSSPPCSSPKVRGKGLPSVLVSARTGSLRDLRRSCWATRTRVSAGRNPPEAEVPSPCEAGPDRPLLRVCGSERSPRDRTAPTRSASQVCRAGAFLRKW
jgi:hypothetical protein